MKNSVKSHGRHASCSILLPDQIRSDYGINRTDEILELWDRLLNASAVGTIFHMFSISITMLIKNHNSHK